MNLSTFFFERFRVYVWFRVVFEVSFGNFFLHGLVKGFQVSCESPLPSASPPNAH